MHSIPNTPRSCRLSDEGREMVERRRMEKNLNRQDVRWHTAAYTCLSTQRRFLAQENILQGNFEALCQCIGLDWQKVVDMSSIIHLPLDILPPIDPLELESNFYINRVQEDKCYELIKPELVQYQSVLIRIKAPQKMGKTSLLTRVLDYADKNSYLNCRLNFSGIQINIRSSLESLLFWFCAEVTNELGIDIKLLEDYWSQKKSGSLAAQLEWCKEYFEIYLLSKLESTLVLGLDEVDSIFPHDQNDTIANEVAANFMIMLRNWFQEGQKGTLWRKLKIVISHSKKDYPNLNINNSPFNIGHAIELKPFSKIQIEDLVKRYQLTFSSEDIQHLYDFFGGHPYLSHRTIYEMKANEVSLVQILQKAPTEGGLFGDLLRSLLSTLDENLTLKSEFIKVLKTNLPIQIEAKEAFQLYSIGLVQYDDNNGTNVVLSGEIYRQYFCNRFRLES